MCTLLCVLCVRVVLYTLYAVALVDASSLNSSTRLSDSAHDDSGDEREPTIPVPDVTFDNSGDNIDEVHVGEMSACLHTYTCLFTS